MARGLGDEEAGRTWARGLGDEEAGRTWGKRPGKPERRGGRADVGQEAWEAGEARRQFGRGTRGLRRPGRREARALNGVKAQLRRGGKTYIESVPNKSNKPAILLRECHRENGKVVKKTLANLSKLPSDVIENFRQSLKGGGVFVDINNLPSYLKLEENLPSGHVSAALTAMERLKISDQIDSVPSWERDTIMGLIAARILFQQAN
ncbi:MAG: hypothetical protein LBO66_04750 [Deltaproteobacteria bacterium]|nr:hypothetical protein [Deltaproteobacteria bacterium]